MTEAADDELCLAIDIGGTKLAVALVDRAGQLLWSDRTRTPHATDPEALFRVLSDLIDLAMLASGGRGRVVAIGIGCGGPMRDELVSPLNIVAWRDFPLADRVRKLPTVAATGCAVALENDAKALALGEGWCGRAAGCRNYLAMVVSTGVGGGIVLDGRLLEGRTGNAGHIGHVIVEPGGRKCGCGASGCLEAEASGTAIEAITGLAAADAPIEIRERTGRLVGRAVGSVANLLDLELVLVGGSVALGFGASFFLAAQRELTATARLSYASAARIEPVGLDKDGPLVGAAAVGWEAAGRKLIGRRQGDETATRPR